MAVQSSFQIYIEEIKYRLIYCLFAWVVCFLTCYTLRDPVLYVIIRPYLLGVLGSLDTINTNCVNLEQPTQSYRSSNRYSTTVGPWATTTPGLNITQFELSESSSSKLLSDRTAAEIPWFAFDAQHFRTMESCVHPIWGYTDTDCPYCWTDFILASNTEIVYSSSHAQVQLDQFTGLLWTNITEAFRVALHSTFFLSFFLTWPFVFYSVWCFFIPGCTHAQRVFTSRICFVFVVLFYLLHVVLSTQFLPRIWYWLLCFGSNTGPLSSIYQARLWESIQFITSFLWWWCTLGTSVPLICFVVLYSGWLPTGGLVCRRRIFFLVAIIISSIIAPPDPVAQFACSVALTFVYELLILMSFFVQRITNTRPSEVLMAPNGFARKA